MGASSGHVRGVNLLRLDGSVTLIVPSIAPKVSRRVRRDLRSPSGGTTMKDAAPDEASFLHAIL